MQAILDWQIQEVAEMFNDVTLWSAPFGRLLLENMPMQQGATVLDIGFGTGFPLIELSELFGASSTIYGIDIWEAAINYTRQKIKLLGIQNITILQESAVQISLPDAHIDIVTSNLGVNNFEERTQVYAEIYRVLKPKGKLCITTNPIGTFEELFDLFAIVLHKLNRPTELQKLKTYINHRQTKDLIVQELQAHGFRLVKSQSDSTQMRFVDALAILDHRLIRIGFRSSWEILIDKDIQAAFYEMLMAEIEQIIAQQGEFRMTIPILYLELEKGG